MQNSTEHKLETKAKNSRARKDAPKQRAVILNPTIVKTEMEAYLAECKEANKVPLFTEFAFRVKVSKDTLARYEKMENYNAMLKRLREAQEIGLQRKILDENKPVGGIFMLKALHGYRENDGQQNNLNVSIGVVMLPPRRDTRLLPDVDAKP